MKCNTSHSLNTWSKWFRNPHHINRMRSGYYGDKQRSRESPKTLEYLPHLKKIFFHSSQEINLALLFVSPKPYKRLTECSSHWPFTIFSIFSNYQRTVIHFFHNQDLLPTLVTQCQYMPTLFYMSIKFPFRFHNIFSNFRKFCSLLCSKFNRTLLLPHKLN